MLIFGNIKPNDASIVFTAIFLPKTYDFLDGIIWHPVVAVNASIQLSVYVLVGGVVSTVHALVFLVNVDDLDFIIGNPTIHQLAGAVGAAVVHDEPLEVFARLAAQAIIGAAQGVGAVVGRGEDGQRFHNLSLIINLYNGRTTSNNKGNEINRICPRAFIDSFDLMK